jgi:protein-disulfide isomerase
MGKRYFQNNVTNQRGKVSLTFLLSLVVVLFLLIDATLFIGMVRQKARELNQNNTNTSSESTILGANPHYAGSADAKVVIVEFSDFQCPYCLQAFPIDREIINTYGNKIKFIYRHFYDATNHPDAEMAAEASECAAAQGKFWEMHDKLFINQDNLSAVALKRYANELGLNQTTFDQCLDGGKYKTRVAQDMYDGLSVGVIGTPTFFINGTKFESVVTLADFKQMIDQLLVIYNVNQ